MKLKNKTLGYCSFIVVTCVSVIVAHLLHLENNTLKKEIQIWQKVIKQYPGGVLVIDTETGFIIDANENCKKLFNKNVEDILNSSFLSLIDENERRKYIVYLNNKNMYNRLRNDRLVFENRNYVFSFQSISVFGEPYYLALVLKSDDRL